MTRKPYPDLAPRAAASSGLCADDVAAIERDTLKAVSPRRLEQAGVWLLPLDNGPIGRARSAVPLRHQAIEPDDTPFDAIEAIYRAHGLAPAWRIADLPGLHAVADALGRRGYHPEQPTLVQCADLQRVLQVSDAPPALLADRPDDAWAAVFLGPGFDPADGAGRVAALSRAGDTRYGSVQEDGQTLAVGALSIGHGWASVHGMRTAAAQRGRGLAGRLLAAFAREAQARGCPRMFLQVEEGNEGARALYRRAGFTTAWRYFYWRRSAASA